jgi:hypothetical protein
MLIVFITGTGMGGSSPTPIRAFSLGAAAGTSFGLGACAGTTINLGASA